MNHLHMWDLVKQVPPAAAAPGFPRTESSVLSLMKGWGGLVHLKCSTLLTRWRVVPREAQNSAALSTIKASTTGKGI
ncbi:hypothetical protein SLE2022_100700 [Rubroshorea leprosula]